MNIFEAANQAFNSTPKRGIRRPSWEAKKKLISRDSSLANQGEFPFMEGLLFNSPSSWAPKTDDILATDWEVI